MRRNAGETELGYWTRREVGDLAKPASCDLVMFMVLPQECHEHFDVEQKRHANWASISLTS